MKRNCKNNRICKHLPIIMGIMFIFISIYNSYENSSNNNIFGIICGIILVIVEGLSSVVPIIKKWDKKSSNSKNRLSENTFTDRQKDLQNLIDLLNTNKIIQLTGNQIKCGKTWLALKLIDYIKHPKDKEFEEYNPLKRNIKNVFYLDIDQKEEADINNFFEDSIITDRTLIIVDHIKRIDYIFSKQNVYGFSLIFITANAIETKGVKYYISEFELKNVPTLQKNINQNYNNIESLSRQEIQCLYDLTLGNIGKIHFLLERQEYVIWIKQIAHNLPTEYDKELNNIQLELFVGGYSLAKKALDVFENKYKRELNNNNDLYFKYFIIKSDCEHLLNNYENALDILLILKNSNFQNYNTSYKVDLLEAHYYKHLWECDNALIILQSIQSLNIGGLTDSLGILVAKYFVDDMSVPNTNDNSLSVFFKTFEMCKSTKLSKSTKDIYKIKRNESIYFYYKKQYTREQIFEPINSVIDDYKNENNRLLANAYFVRAELNRLFRNYKKALLDYNRSLEQTDDNNIKIQVNIMKYYLSNIKRIKYFKSDEHLTKQEISNLCKDKNNYGMLLVRRINSIELDDPQKNQIIDCFEHRVMTIL